MPPVFGPRSPSLRRLWSCAAGITLTVLPSLNAMSETSSPSSRSSITTWSPAAPNSLSSMMRRSAARGAEYLEAGRAQRVRHAARQRGFGADDDQVDVAFARAGDERRLVVGAERDVLRERCCAGVAGGDVELREARGLRGLPGQ